MKPRVKYDLKNFPYHITKLALYVRKSREDEELERMGIDSLTEQIAEMKRFLDGYDVQYDIFQEVGSGESINERNEFQRLLSYIENETDAHGGSPYQAIACRELARLSRGKGADQERIADLVTDFNIFIINKSGKIYDPRNESDLQAIRMEGFLNHEFYRQVNYLLKNGRYRAADEGFWPTGSVPYGYELMKVNKHKKLHPIDEQAKIVQLIFDWYIHSNVRERAIATKLQRMGIKTANGKLFSPTTISRMLVNEAYIGTVTYGKSKRRKTDKKVIAKPKEEWTIVENAHQAIISREDFERVQEIKNDIKKKPPVPLDFTPNELAGLIKCNCGKIMIRQISPYKYEKKDGTVSKYNRYFLTCLDCSIHGSVYVKYYDVEAQLLNVLEQKVEINSEKLSNEIQKAMITQNTREEIFSKDELMLSLEKERARLLEAIDDLFKRYEHKKLIETIFERQLELRQNELVEIEQKIETLKTKEEPESVKVDTVQAKQNIKGILDVYLSLESKEEKNVLLRGIFNEVQLHLMGKKPKRFELMVDLNWDLILS